MKQLRKQTRVTRRQLPRKRAGKSQKLRTCRRCGCTDADCSQCIEKTGHACHWVAADLCSACAVA